MNKRLPIFAGALLPLFIAILVCIDHGIYPFGDQCMLQVDMYHQYCPFFTELLDKLKEGGSIFYSWRIGLGADFISLFAYYLSSPLNVFLLFCPPAYVIEFMTILVLLKLSFSGASFTAYLIAHFKIWESGREAFGGLPRPIAAFAAASFGCAYALSAFMAAYAWNIMWLDCMALAPLVLLGSERLVDGQSPVLYYVSLALCIWSNFYIAIMVCIFCVLWFFLYWLEHRAFGFRAWVRFAWYSLLAGGSAAVLIVPTAIVLGYSGNQGTSFPETVEWYFHLTAELARHLLAVPPYTGTEHWPNLYCGLFVLVLFVLYLLNCGISWKRKLPRLFLVAFFVLSFANNFLDFVWHGFHFPTSLPGRQSFLYILLLLTIAFEAFLQLRKNRLWHLPVTAGVLAVFLVCAYFASEEELLGETVFFVSAAFISCYLILLCCYLAGKARMRRLMLGVGCLAVLAELTINYDLTGFDTVSRTAYLSNRKGYQSVLMAAEEARGGAGEGASFYRVEELERRTKNDAALYGYPSATQFSSLMNLDVSHFYQNVGMEGGKNFYCANGATPLLSAMLSIRYVLADNDMEAGPLRHPAASAQNVWLYENAYVLPLGFMMPEDVIAAWDYEGLGDIGAQNELARLLGASEHMLTPVSSFSNPGESCFLAEEDGYYYAAYDSTSVSELTAEMSNGRSRSYTKVSHGYMLELGYCTAGTEVTIKNEENETLGLTVYRLNEQAFLTAYEALAAQTMQLESFSGDAIGGTIRVEQAGRLIFSIANETGWSLYVDGERIEPESFAGAFLSVHLEPGTHEIRLRYKTPGFSFGAGVSLGSAALAAGSVIFWKRKNNKSELLD